MIFVGFKFFIFVGRSGRREELRCSRSFVDYCFIIRVGEGGIGVFEWFGVGDFDV